MKSKQRKKMGREKKGNIGRKGEKMNKEKRRERERIEERSDGV